MQRYLQHLSTGELFGLLFQAVGQFQVLFMYFTIARVIMQVTATYRASFDWEKTHENRNR